MSADLWTAEDVELVARAGYTGNWDELSKALRYASLNRARRVLTALAEAGRLASHCTEEEPCKQCRTLLRDIGYGPYDEPEEIRLAVHGASWTPVDPEKKP